MAIHGHQFLAQLTHTLNRGIVYISVLCNDLLGGYTTSVLFGGQAVQCDVQKTAWAENGHLYIQNEFCNGGSLAEEIALHQKRGTRFTEAELKDILKQVAHGLKYIHAQQLAHMDIKPGM